MFQNYKLSRPVFFLRQPSYLNFVFFFSYIYSPPDCILQGPKNNRFPICIYIYTHTYIHTYIWVHALLYTCTQTINEPLILYIQCACFPFRKLWINKRCSPYWYSHRAVYSVYTHIYIYILHIYVLCSHTDVRSLTCGARGKMYLKIVCIGTILYMISLY